MRQVLRFPGFQIEASADWNDITDTLESAEKPFTVARADGVGALQFSPALYRGGPVPSPSDDELLSMAIEFGGDNGLGEAFDADRFAGSLAGAGVSYHSRDEFIRVWFVSDRGNFMLATYVCEWQHRERELAECEDIVRSLQFVDPP
jgi:hypothetical protein